MVTTPTPQQILDLPMQDNDAEAATIRDYLIALLAGVWTEQEGFSGKRPFGNSGWSGELEVPLIKAGYVTGRLDEDGYIESIDGRAAHALIASAIKALGETPVGEVWAEASTEWCHGSRDANGGIVIWPASTEAVARREVARLRKNSSWRGRYAVLRREVGPTVEDDGEPTGD